MAQFISVEEIIQDLFIEEGKSSEHEYLRYFNLALQGLKELNFDTVRQIKSIELNLDHKNTVKLPSDYVSFTKIGITDNDGEMNYLGRRDRINLVHGTTSSVTEDKTQHPVFTDNVPGDGLYARFGEGGGNNVNGYYRENLDEGTIEFSELSGSVIIEYISDGLAYDLDSRIPKLAEEAMYQHLLYSILSTRTSTAAIAPQYKKQRYAALRNAKIRLSNIKLDEIAQVMRGKSKWIKR